ncbi:zinc finger CCHC domain-containing protein 8 homolog [Parasteatoda tepidariorum]|uniref:zinc finger CCHC domain-containing protein 8 homolog n=1 Tax=Parasteatoda tepidariorum TaxID=114398 RepID=UPI0039BC6CB2
MEPFTLNEDSSGGDTSPSLVELEEIKKRLVMALGIDAEPSSPVAVANEDSVQSLKTVDSDTVENTNEFSNLSDSSFSSKASTSGKSVSNSGILPRTDSIGSKLVSLGTPSISRHSSFTRLPNYENFSKNVTSHMDFENLPSSVGTYQRMKKVIKKVKNKLNSLMH